MRAEFKNPTRRHLHCLLYASKRLADTRPKAFQRSNFRQQEDAKSNAKWAQLLGTCVPPHFLPVTPAAKVCRAVARKDKHEPKGSAFKGER